LVMAAAWISAGEMAAMAVVVIFIVTNLETVHYEVDRVAANLVSPSSEWPEHIYTRPRNISLCSRALILSCRKILLGFHDIEATFD
jgi:hypothetical protein